MKNRPLVCRNKTNLRDLWLKTADISLYFISISKELVTIWEKHQFQQLESLVLNEPTIIINAATKFRQLLTTVLMTKRLNYAIVGI
jgi:hypothetical protein